MRPTPQNSVLSTIVLVPGHWLGAWAWDEVLTHLRTAGLRAVAMTLPGLDDQDPGSSSRTLEEQAAAIQAVVDSVPEGVVLVGHSGANAPVSLVLDRSPELIRRVVWVDSGPVTPGNVFAPELPESVEELPLPSFDVLGERASLEGLSADDLDRFRARAVPEPGPVLWEAVQLTNDARLGVPTTLVCCSIPSTRILELAHMGHPMFAEVSRLEHVEVVDLPTGHWPMWSRAEDLAETIRDAALRPT
ncbi:alpha/beta fold hydrolase [Propionibacterium australiense]|uniref:Alpha/beta fold hydrolase n=1 Tax=Propionibacterium australiense TaxID=119981 RepID=A0A383S2F9_9ACTN|nr:alpha/beta hydrolase [Propionibacterium australiense]RLP11472.1 alpha/beta fold hydrolase [Propionibacterium australiense]RLP12791.1 alpha/beta fold hydrolase [Propionibacterium australiense]SYZ32170.1 Alpha/beta hydrolase fold-1 [Propionibacterium australiense]VEH90758.1 Alpha/beta hydrolase family [Propionibacterium australiense]